MKDEVAVAGCVLEHMAPPGALLEQAKAGCCAWEAASMEDRQPVAARQRQWDDAWLQDRFASIQLMAVRQVKATG